MSLPVLVLSLWMATGATAPTGGAAAASAPAPDPMGWWGLGGSELGPHSLPMQGSASGAGVRGTPGLWMARPLIDSTGAPFVAWVDSAGVHAARFQHGVWTDLPFGASAHWDVSGFPLASMPAVALDGKGRVLVAWIERPLREPPRLRLFRERSGGWDDVTPASQPRAPWCMSSAWNAEFGAMAAPPALVIDGAARAAALCDTFRVKATPPGELRMFPAPPPGPPAVEVQRWDGKRWRKLPLVDIGGQGQPGPSVAAFALDAAGVPLLVLGEEPRAPRKTSVLHGAQARWERLPGDDGEEALSGLASDATSSLWRVVVSREGTLGFHALAPSDTKTEAPTPLPLSGPLASVVRASWPVQFFLGRDGRVLAVWLGGDWAGRGASFYAALWTGTAWEDLASTVQVHGGVSRTPGASDHAAVALDSKGRPVVAWLEASPGSDVRQVYLRRWNGEAWEELGGSAHGGGVSGEKTDPPNVISGVYSVSLALTREDRPVVAWFALRPNRVVAFVREWDGTRWVELPSPNEAQPSPSDRDAHPSPPLHLAVDARGQPVIGFATGGLNAWMVSQWDGARWNTSRVEGSAGAWSLFTTSSGGLGRWRQDENGQVQLARALPAEALAEQLPSPGGRVHTMERPDGAALALDAAGRPVITWEDPGNGEVFLLRWTGTAWEALSGSGSGGGVSHSAAASRHPALAVDARTCVAWSEQDVLSTEVFLRCHGP